MTLALQMADSFRSWICAYLIDIGETYGGNLSDAPYWEKKKKVQLVEVRNHGYAVCSVKLTSFSSFSHSRIQQKTIAQSMPKFPINFIRSLCGLLQTHLKLTASQCIRHTYTT